MVGTVSKLKRMKARLHGEADTAIEVPFEIKCDCGETVRGVRRASWIEKECPQCGQSLFVLPTNVYPTTRAVPSDVLGGTLKDRLKTIVSEIVPARKKKEKQRSTGKSKKQAVVETAASGETITEEDLVPKRRLPRLSLPKVDVKRIARRTFTPFRMLMLAMIAVLGVTGYWVSRQKSMESARHAWLESGEQVEQLLSDRKLAEVERLLSDAVAAGRVLGKSDPEWRATLNLFHETQAVNRLGSGDLVSAFHDAYDDDNQLKPDAQQTVFFAIRNGPLVFDSWLNPMQTPKGTFVLDFPVTPGRDKVLVTIRLPQLSRLLDTIEDQRVCFSAEVSSVAAPAPGLPWKLKLDPGSFVLLTREELCSEIGLSVEYDPDVRILLERQKQFVESSDSWEFRANDVVADPIPDREKDNEESSS